MRVVTNFLQVASRTTIIGVTGPPVSGKTSQTTAVAAPYGFPVIETSQELRRMHGDRVVKMQDRGEMVPDEMVLEALIPAFARHQDATHIFWVGAGRLLTQVPWLRPGDMLVEFSRLKWSHIQERHHPRVYCPVCNFTELHDPEKDQFWKAGCNYELPLEVRGDDRWDVVKRRFDKYYERREGIVRAIRGQKTAHIQVDARQPRETVRRQYRVKLGAAGIPLGVTVEDLQSLGIGYQEFANAKKQRLQANRGLAMLAYA